MKKTLLLALCGVILLIAPFMTTTQVEAQTSLYDGMIELGNDHTLVLTKESIVYAFGRNLYGQIGDGSGENQLLPVDITASFSLLTDETIIDIAAGGASSAVLTSESRIFVWGANGDGQLGDGTYEDKTTPVEITGNFTLNEGESIVAIDMGNAFSAALTSDGRVFIWGSSSSNQLGDTAYPYGTNMPIDLTPSLGLNEGESIKSIELGSIHALAITTDNRILAWGDNDDGECGVTASNNEPTAVDITSAFGFTGDEHVLFVSAGEAVSYVVSNLGTVFSFGRNGDYELGDGTQITPTAPINVTSQFSLGESETVSAISSGTYFSTLVTSEGRLFVWGVNWYEALGTGTSSTQENPYEITSRVTMDVGERVVYTTSSKYFSAVVTTTGDVHMWGRGDRGQLGLGNTDNIDIPTFNGLNLAEPDVTPPTCDETPDQTIEAGEYTNIDWTTYITGVEDETGGAVTLTETSDPVLYNTVGTYTVSIDLTDTSDNVFTETFDVHVVDTTAPTFDPIPNQQVQLDSEPIDWATYITNPSDNASGILTTFVVTNTIDYTTVGIYDVTVKLTDASSNETEQSFTVEVIAGEPVIQYRTITQSTEDPYHYVESLNAVDVAIGIGHTVVLTAAGDVFSWGFNESGQLGDGTQIDTYIPINITPNFNLNNNEVIIKIEAQFQQNLALSNQGRLFVWGCNDTGRFPVGDVNILEPADITSMLDLQPDETIIDFEMSCDQLVLLTSMHRVLSFSPTDQTYFDTVYDELATNNDYIIEISFSGNCGIILSHLGQVYTFGWNRYSQLADGTTVEWSTGLSNITDQFTLHENEIIIHVFMADVNAAVITSENRVLHWGMYNNQEIEENTGRYQTDEIMDITNDFNLQQGETVIAMYGGIFSSIFVTSNYRVFSMADYLNGDEVVTSNRSYVIDQTNRINPDGKKLIDFELSDYNWAWVFGDGTVYTYGNNSHGQLSIEDPSNTAVQVEIEYHQFTIEDIPYLDISTISSSSTHTLAVTNRGLLLAWGDNTKGQLGTGDTTSISNPNDISDIIELHDGERYIDAIAGVGFSIIITSENRVFVMGDNSSGQLGNGTFTSSLTPIEITSRFMWLPGETVAKVTTGTAHVLLLTTAGRLFAWGNNVNDQVGVTSYTNINIPQNITHFFASTSSEYVIDIATGENHNLAITSLNRVFAWGLNNNGQIGNGTASAHTYVPINITANFYLGTDRHITDIAAGSAQSYAISSDGNMFTWGNNAYGQLGDGTTTAHYTPAPITGRFTFAANEYISTIVAGTHCAYAMTTAGNIWVWGRNESGQLGLTYTSNYENSPINATTVITSYLDSWPIQFTSIHSSTYVLTEEGRLFAVGRNDTGQLGNNTTTTSSTYKEIYFDPTNYMSLWYIDTQKETIILDDVITILLYPNENCGEIINTILINDTYHPLIYLEDGVMRIEINNTYNIGDSLLFNFKGGTLTNGDTFTFTGNTYTATTIVADNIPPTFTLNNRTINIDELSPTFDDWTIYAENINDNSGEDVTLTVVSSTVLNKIPGTYQIVIEAEDTSGNTHQETCTITLIDTQAPTLTQLPSLMETIMAGEYIDRDWTLLVTGYYDNSDAPITLIEHDNVDYNTPKNYSVTVDVVDSSGNKVVVTIIVTVTEDIRPHATLNPGIDTFYVDGVWTDPGVTITNSEGTTLTVTGINVLDEDTPGTYPITYTISSQWDDVVLVRYVTVLAAQTSSTQVTFTFNDAISTIVNGDQYIDTGCTATDGTTTYQCMVQSNNVNIYSVGTYQVVYYVTINGVTYTTTRYVFVVSDMVVPELYFIKEEEVAIV